MITLVQSQKHKGVDKAKSSSNEKSRIRLVERTPDHLLDGAADAASRSPRGVRRLRDLRRQSIKIMTMFRTKGIFVPDRLVIPRPYNLTGSAHDTTTAIAACKTSSHTTDVSQCPDTPQTQDIHTIGNPSVANMLDTAPESSLHHTGSSLTQLTSAVMYDGESEPITEMKPFQHTALHASRSMAGLSQQISLNLSNALLSNPTVIRRPKLSSRPTVLTKAPQMDSSSGKSSSPDRMDNVPSLPSQFSSGPESSNGPLSPSTAPTSVVSSGGPVSAETTHRARVESVQRPRLSQMDRPVAGRNAIHWLNFPRQDVPRLIKPSVATVEKAAAAKIFFEAHFNQLLGAQVSPRSMRRRQLERKIFTMALPNEQRQYRRQR